MGNIINMRNYSLDSEKHTNQKWINKPQPKSKKDDRPLKKYYIHKRNGEYWFGDKPVKYLIRKARQQGLIVAPSNDKT